MAPVAAGLAAVERLQRAGHHEHPPTSQGQPSPPKRPFKTPSLPSLCALATRATLQLMSGERLRHVGRETRRRFVSSLLSLCAHSSQHAVQQQSGGPYPRAGGASAQSHVTRKAPSPTYPGALLWMSPAEVCPQLLPLLHKRAAAAVAGLHGAQTP